MTRPTALFFAIQAAGHVRRLLTLARGIADEGLRVIFCTHNSFKPLVERAGVEFFDLFERYPLDETETDYRVRMLRHIFFADQHREEMVRELREFDPSLVVYDTPAVIGRAVAASLGIPWVNACWGHDPSPARWLREIFSGELPIPQRYRDATERIADLLGFPSDPPLSPPELLVSLSPYLNVVAEPAAYLTAEERRALEPVAFYGSLSLDDRLPESGAGGVSAFPGEPGRRRVFVSFGTQTWSHHAREILGVLSSIAGVLGSADDVSILISLGGGEVTEEVNRALARPNVSVAGWVDQWRVLQEADVFVTHHGMNGTHEAIFQRVPMISYPFGGDQPSLAKKCQEFGFAIPLTDRPIEPVTTEAARAVFERFDREEESMRARLEEAREWELETIAGRGAVNRRIIDLIGR
jgi:UDP:flavonoid glycosyltransferase YjiC (YdhE family)